MTAHVVAARVFLLSPATLSGARGRRVLAGDPGVGPFMVPLARGEAVPLASVYASISSLYFRGKLAYAERFARGPTGGRPVVVGAAADGRPIAIITPNRGLVPVGLGVTAEELRELASTDIDPAEPRYAEPLEATARALAEALDRDARVVLLGSIATGKYVEPLADVLGARLVVPRSFVGRGDMSRGGLLLRAAAAGEELDYAPPSELARRGARPPRLGPAGPPARSRNQSGPAS